MDAASPETSPIPKAAVARMLVVVAIAALMPCLALPSALDQLESARDSQRKRLGHGQGAETNPEASPTPSPSPAPGDLSRAPEGRRGATRSGAAAAEIADIPGTAPVGASAPATPGGPFLDAAAAREAEQIQLQLQALGASYFVLKYHSAPRLYDFRCEVEVPSARGFRRPFTATAPLAQQAMREVLAGVAQWRDANREAFVR